MLKNKKGFFFNVLLALTLALGLGLAAADPALAATITSVANGQWSTTGTWDLGRIPTATDEVIINNSNVSFDATNATVESLTVNPSMSLYFPGSSAAATPRVLRITGGLTNNGTFRILNKTGGAFFTQIYIAGNFTNNGEFRATDPVGGTARDDHLDVFLNGTAAQSLGGASTTTFRNLTISNTSGIVTATNNFFITAEGYTAYTLTIESNATLYMDTYVVSGAGTCELKSGATLGIGSTEGITSSGATGNIRVTGRRFFNTGAKYTYNGSAAQATGNGLPATVNNLTINNSAGVTLSASVTASNILTLTSGQVTSTSSNLLAVTNTSAGAVTGYSSAGYVNGPLQWSLATGSSYFFPVGDASNYRPFELNSITCSSPVVRVTMASSGASTVDSTLSSVAPRNWYAQLISGSFTSATVRITESGLGSTNVVANSSAQSGPYTNQGGNSIGSTITSNAGISYTASTYFAIGSTANTSAFFQLFE